MVMMMMMMMMMYYDVNYNLFNCGMNLMNQYQVIIAMSMGRTFLFSSYLTMIYVTISYFYIIFSIFVIGNPTFNGFSKFSIITILDYLLKSEKGSGTSLCSTFSA